jgi:hypothetical protein
MNITPAAPESLPVTYVCNLRELTESNLADTAAAGSVIDTLFPVPPIILFPVSVLGAVEGSTVKVVGFDNL